MVKNTPAANAARKEESRHVQCWYPQRCEHPGCSETSKEVLKKCSACKMVMYCSKDHQTADWPAHKEECKVFQRVGVRASFYTDEDMLQRYPLQPCVQSGHCSSMKEVPLGASCALCGKNDQQEQMTRTRCCNQVICDNTDRYVLCSFSREYCERSHGKFTLCGDHVDAWQPGCDRSKDWRECPGCTQRDEHEDSNKVASKLWRGLNSYNFAPLLTKDVPKHALCETCTKCHSKIMMRLEGASFPPGGAGLTCLVCDPLF